MNMEILAQKLLTGNLNNRGLSSKEYKTRRHTKWSQADWALETRLSPPGLRPGTHWRCSHTDWMLWEFFKCYPGGILWHDFWKVTTHGRNHSLKPTENCPGDPRVKPCTILIAAQGVQGKACRQGHNIGGGARKTGPEDVPRLSTPLWRGWRTTGWKGSQEQPWGWHAAIKLPEKMLADAGMADDARCCWLPSAEGNSTHTAEAWHMGCPEPGGEKPFLLHCLCSPLTKHNICKLAKKRYLKDPSIFLQGS